MRSAPIRSGVDGIMVSNHGARQLDNAPSPLQVLPAIRDAVGDKMTVMFDGGIRRGLDAIIALCMGAKFVLRRPSDALRRDGGRHPGRGRGAADLPARGRHQHGADRRHQDRRPRPAVPDVEGRGGSAPQPALIRVIPKAKLRCGAGSRFLARPVFVLVRESRCFPLSPRRRRSWQVSWEACLRGPGHRRRRVAGARRSARFRIRRRTSCWVLPPASCWRPRSFL